MRIQSKHGCDAFSPFGTVQKGCKLVIDESMGMEKDNSRVTNVLLAGIKPTGTCVCGEDVYGTKFCSVECSSRSTRRVDRPSRGILAQQIASMSWVDIGKHYGVSDNAVRKWAKLYGLLL